MARQTRLLSIVVDQSIQPRADGTDKQLVSEFAECMRAGDVFPPIVVYEDGDKLWLSEGFHRVAAADMAELDTIKAEVRPGNRKDALVNACGRSNAIHGSRETNADKRLRVTRLIDSFPKYTDKRIADLAGVNHHLVSEVRGVGETPTSQQGGFTSPHDRAAYAAIERKLLEDRKLIDAEPEDVAGQLDAESEMVATVQEALSENAREYADGRKRYDPVFSKPLATKPRAKQYKAVQKFTDIMMSVARIHDELAQEYKYDYTAMFTSEDWNPRFNGVAINYIIETRKLLDRIDDVIAIANAIRKNMDTRAKIEVAKIHGTRCFFEGRGKGPCCDIAEVGHLVPSCHGGHLSIENCMIECRNHNNQRRERTIEEYLRSEDRVGD